VARETHLPVRFRKVAGVCQRCDHEPRCSRGSESTGGLRPPLLYWRANVRRRNSDLCDAQTHISRSGWCQPALGAKIAPAMAIGVRGVGVITFTTHDRMVHHGWLTRIAPGAALGGRTPIVANVRWGFARAIRFTTTAGLRQPLLVHEAGPLKNNDIRGAQTHVLQERRALAPVVRRPFALVGHSEQSSGNTDCRIKMADRQPAVVRESHPQHRAFVTERECSHATGGLRPPALGGPAMRTFTGETATCAIHERSFTRAAGVSPPWFGSRTGNGDRLSWSDFVHHSRSCGTPRLAHASCSRRRSWWTHANRRKCAASLCTGESFHSHGWLTPAAPGVRRRSAEK
jgi:hypothetical protein